MNRFLRFHLRYVLATVAALSLASASNALTFVPASDASLVDRADVIVEATVLGDEPLESAAGIVTRYRLAATHVLKGDPDRRDWFLDVPGGTLADGRFARVIGLPHFGVGDEILLFADERGTRLRIVHDNQGVFFRGAGAGAAYWVRDDHGAQVLAPKAGASRPDRFATPREATSFEAWVRDRVAGLARAADYFADGVHASRPPSKFTRLRENPPVRWFEFDRGETVALLWDNASQRSLAADVDDLRKSRLLWNRQPDTPIRIVPGGPITADVPTTGGVIVALFRDAADLIEQDHSCTEGGTVAIAQVFGDLAVRERFKGEGYAIIREGLVVVNDGAACEFALDPRAAEQVLAHELGHVLGLGHSCGDDDSGPCGSFPRRDAALMRATLHQPAIGAVLTPDDVAGIRFLYDPVFTSQRPSDDPRPCALPPGHPRFCTECGPCTAGQGDCDRDAECATGLICTNDRGADFGFAPGIDVCLGDDEGRPGPPPPCALPPGHPRFCVECGPCVAGEGDCDGDDECAAGTTCTDNVGATFGFAPGIDVCLAGDSPPCDSIVGRGDFCSVCGPCGAGEGDCDSDAECAPGLSCVDDVGPSFGFGARVDVCM